MAGVDNLLFIIADQWRGDTLGAVAHPCVKTPNLDRLAAEGVVFRNHFTQASPCGPARASILTGLYLHNHRQVTNETPLDRRFTNLALELGRAGYQAALFGYTDTPLDPRAAPGGRDWICPGFTAVAPFLFADGFADWRAALAARGHALPERVRDTFLPADGYRRPAGDAGFAPCFYTAEESDTAFLADAALDYLDERGARPWFVHFCCLRPHPPMVAPAPYDRMYDPAAMALPARPIGLDAAKRQHPFLAWSIESQRLREYFHAPLRPEEIEPADDRRMRATYYGNCSEVDAQIGRLVDRLKATGAYDRTLIVFCSDHGEQLGDNWLYGRRGYFDGHFHVPCIIRDPRPAADAARGRQVEAFTECIDLMPTMLEALGLDIPAACEGRSLAPFLLGETPADWRAEAHWAFDFRDLAGHEPETALGLRSEQCNLAVIRGRRYKYVHFASLPPLLFDLKADPGECRNLADDPAHAPVVLEFAQKMLSWRLAHDDRTLTGLRQPYASPPQPAAPAT